VVLSVDKPMTKNTIPRMRKAPDAFRLFCFIIRFILSVETIVFV
jgi:hypothetical protein